jgi:hypothetical protein
MAVLWCVLAAEGRCYVVGQNKQMVLNTAGL